MKLAERVTSLFEATYRQRKIKDVKIGRYEIKVTWAATDKMDDDVEKSFPVTDDIADLVHIFKSTQTTDREKRIAKEQILKKIL